jgi:hypothetical protein
MFPMDRKAINENPVTVEYDSRDNRVRKVLPNAIEARRFYARMLRENRNPQIVGKQGQ